MLTGDGQRLLAGSQHDRLRGSTQQLGNYIDDRGNQMLAVVEHQQHRLVAESIHQLVLPDSQGGRDRLHHRILSSLVGSTTGG